MLRFYDQLRRQRQQVTRFEELILDALGPGDGDTGTDRMRRQTLFLADAFREYERRLRALDALDEHLLRERLIADAAPEPVRQIVVAVADWIADADGLFVADFDLLARLAGLESIDLVATERLLGSGFHERVHEWWPGIEEIEMPAEPGRPVLVAPPGAATDLPWWTHRDREEELAAVARMPIDNLAVVFKRPLPYLYVAPKIFSDAGLAIQTSLALPLAAEPTAAALDLVLEAVATKFTRGSLVALLRSPHFVFASGADALTRDAISALDRALSEARYLGDPDVLAGLAAAWTHERSRPALQAALELSRELTPLADARRASAQLSTLAAFWAARLAPLADNDSFVERERRARAAIGDLLSALASAHAAEDDPAWTVDELAVAVRRAIEDHTFAAESSGHGVHLVDDQAARFGA